MRYLVRKFTFVTLFAFSGLVFAGTASEAKFELRPDQQDQIIQIQKSNDIRDSDAACFLRTQARCPACCTGCGTSSQDCSGCKPKPSGS